MTARKTERLLFRVAKGGAGLLLIPNDGYTAKRLQERGYAPGDRLLTELRKPRNPGFWRLAHSFGQMVANNIEDFSGMTAHTALKRLQIEGNIACDEVPAFMEIMGQKIKVNQRIPRSLSFASMEDGEFKDVYRQFSAYVSREYWPEMTPAQIEQMAELMPEAA